MLLLLICFFFFRFKHIQKKKEKAEQSLSALSEAEQQKLELQEPAVTKPESQEPEPQKLEPQEPEPQKLEPQEPELQKLEPQEPEPQKLEPQEPELQKLESQEPEPQNSLILNRLSPSDIPGFLRAELERRRLLEDRIMCQVGGRTGLDMLWGEMNYWSGKGEVQKFLQFARNYPEKAELMRKDYVELRNMLTEDQIKQYKKFAEKGNEDARLLGLSYQYLDKCERLLENSSRLSPLLGFPNGENNPDTISPEKLIKWHAENSKR